MEFEVGVFTAGPTEFENAVQFPAVFSFGISGSQNITITSTDNVLSIGDGLAGPGIGANATVDEIVFRTITTSQGDFDVAVIISDGSNNALIVPVDPVGGTITTDILPLETGITVGAELGVTSYLLEAPAGGNTPPVADDLSTSVDEDMVLNGTVTGSDAEDDDATLTFALGTDATNGTATVNGNGTFTYTPDTGFDGTDTFTFTVTDSDGASSTGTVTVTVNNTDVPTMATVVAYLVPDGDVDAAVGGFGNGILAIDATQVVDAMIDSADDILSDDDVVTAPTINGLNIETLQFHELTLGGDMVTVAILGFGGSNNSLVIPLDAGGVAGIALESADYTASGPLADPMAMLMDTELPAPNTPPVADDQNLSVDENMDLTGTLTGTDVEDDDTTLTFALATNAANGNVVVNPDGTFTYTPDADFDGPDGFTFTVTDSDAASTTGTVTITVNNTDAPTISTVVAYLVPDGDVDAAVGGFGNGILTIDATQVVDATITSSDDVLSDDDSVTAPTIAGLEIETLQFHELTLGGDTVTVAILGFTGSNNSLVIPLDAGGVAGIALESADYTASGPLADPMAMLMDTELPAPNPTMATVVAYLVPDGDVDAAVGGFGNGILAIDATQVVDAMIDSADDILSDDDVVTAPTIAGLEIETLQFHDLTLNGDTVTVAILGFAGSNNSLVIPLDAGGVAGIALESDDYTASGPLADPMAMLMDTELPPPNTPPVADDQDLSVDEDMVLNGTLTGSDVEDDDTTLTFALANDAANGNVVVNPDGTFSYTPDAGFDGPDSFTFTVTDSDAASTTGTVTITVNNTDVPTTSTVVAYLVPDGDVDAAVGGFGNGILAIDATQVVDAVIDSDDDVLSDDDVVTAPTIAGLEIETLQFHELTLGGDTVTVAILGFTGSNNSLVIPLDAGGVAGIALQSADYTASGPLADPMAMLMDTELPPPTTATVVAYLVADGDVDAAVGGFGNGILTIDATQLVDAVIDSADDVLSDDDVVTAPTIAGLEIETLQFHDLTLNGDTVTVAILGFAGSNNSLVIPLDAGGVAGIALESDDYTASGPLADPMAMLMDTSLNDDPVADDGTVTGDEDTVISGTVVANDADMDPLMFAVITDPVNGMVTVDPSTGDFDYTPDPNFFGTDSFVVEVTDGNGGVDTATIDITVNSVNDLPVADDLAVEGDEDTVISGTVTATDVEDDDATLTFAVATDPTHGSVTVNPDGTFDYTPDPDFFGTDSFTFTATDSDGGAGTGTVTITVENVGETFFGSSGTQIFGGTPGLIDTVDFTSSTTELLIFLTGSDGDTSTGSGGDALGDLFISIENIIGGSGNDVIFDLGTDPIDNTIDGGLGNDVLSGGLGSDSLGGGSGNDILDGSDGGEADILDGGIGLDIASYSSATSGINFDLGDPNNPPNPLAGPGEIDQDQLISIEGLIGAGGFSNTLVGDNQDNVLIGGDQADSLSGNGGNDVISGLAGDDIIDGGAGIDILVGEQGVDTLTGGAGNDIFDIQLNSSVDIITDFEVGGDTIRFFGTGLVFDDLVILQDANGTDVNITAAGTSIVVTLLNQDENLIDDSSNFGFI